MKTRADLADLVAAAARRFIEVEDAGGPSWCALDNLRHAVRAYDGDANAVRDLDGDAWRLRPDGSLPVTGDEWDTVTAP